MVVIHNRFQFVCKNDKESSPWSSPWIGRDCDASAEFFTFSSGVFHFAGLRLNVSNKDRNSDRIFDDA